MPSRSPAPAPRARRGRTQLAIALLGAWSILPPYLGPAVGLGLDVPAKVEVVDHVLPGVAIALAGAAAALLARRGEEAERSLLTVALTSLCFLGGFWQAATHAPLLLDVGGRESPWGAVLLHSTAGPLIAAVALWLTLRALGGSADVAGRR